MQNACIRAVRAVGAIVGLAACSGIALAGSLTGVDVGSPSNPGSLSVNGNQMTIVGGGADIWDASDPGFYYAYMPITGDFDYVVQVVSLVGNSGDGGWTKLELMARLDDLIIGSPLDGGDPFIANMTTRSSADTANGAPAGDNNLGPQWRAHRAGTTAPDGVTVWDGSCSWTAPTPAVAPNMPNNWMRLERVGSVFYMYWSYDGTNWAMYNPYSPQGWDTAGSWPEGADNAAMSYFTNAWPSSIYLGIAVCAHNDASYSTGVVSNFGPWTPVPIAINQPPPATLTAAANSSAFTLSVGASGDPVHYKWFKNGAAIPQAVGPSFSSGAWVQPGGAGTYTVQVFGGGKQIMSSACVVTVTADTTPPTIVKAAADITFTNVLVTFSEPVTDSALTASHYALDGGATVSSVARIDLLTVQLTTSKLAENTTYNLTVNGVQDTATPANTIAAGTKVQFRSFVFLTGTILHKKYDNCSDAYTLANFFADPRYPSDPDRLDLETMWEYPPGGVARVAADPVRNYCDTLEGYFIPPTNGNYVFFICGDDEYYLYLSTDDSPANLFQICSEPGGWTDDRSWVTAHSGDLTAMRSDQYTGTQWPNANANTITLTAGKRYYLLSMHHDHSWSGGDYHGVTYKLDTEADPNDGDAPRLTGSNIGYYFDPTGASVTFTQQPQNASCVIANSVTFTAAATGTSVYGTTVFYQWQSAPKGSSTWTNIANAMTASYATPLLVAGDNGTQFRVIASVPPVSATSTVASVTVSTDTTPPVVTVGAMQDPTTAGTVDIGVGFNKPVDTASGSLLANYTVSSGTITSLTWYTNRFTANSKNPLVMTVKQTALLKVTGLSGSGTLTVKNVADTFGNKITSTNVAFTVDPNMKWGVVGANQTGGWNAVVPVAANGFDVYSDGIAEWGNYDETTFVYEQVTGDFDKKLRVQYQDGSSEWGRAGLIVRDVTDFGVDAATQEGSQPGNTPVAPYDGKAGRYQKCHVNPVGATLTGPGTAGNQSWEGNRRLDTGGGCTTALTGVNAVPQYPNAWCRIKRQGQKFTIFRSNDGVTWVTLGTTTWGVDDTSKTPMPATVYVGPEFSPENGNITQAADQGTFLAQFRDYGDYVANPQLTVSMDATGKVTISWAAGTLVGSSTVHGTYAPVTGATSPYVVTPTAGATMFYQVTQ